MLALSLIVLTTLVAMGRTAGLDRWVDEAIPKEGEGPAPLYALAVAITTVANPPLTMTVLLIVVALWVTSFCPELLKAARHRLDPSASRSETKQWAVPIQDAMAHLWHTSTRNTA